LDFSKSELKKKLCDFKNLLEEFESHKNEILEKEKMINSYLAKEQTLSTEDLKDIGRMIYEDNGDDQIIQNQN
jgi:hypothetical protein